MVSAAQLDMLRQSAVESFAGVGTRLQPEPFEKVGMLDVGSWSGTAMLIAAGLWRLDMKPAMLRKGARMRQQWREAGGGLGSTAEQIRLPAQSVDLMTSTGERNLVPDKLRACAEIFRVLRLEATRCSRRSMIGRKKIAWATSWQPVDGMVTLRP